MSGMVDDDERVYIVLVNQEGQYSLWPEDLRIANGWSQVGRRGSRKECMDWVDETWRDMRPLSLVHFMETE